MPIIHCPTCRSMLEVDRSSIGFMVECGSCNARFTAELPRQEPPPLSASEPTPGSPPGDDTWRRDRQPRWEERPPAREEDLLFDENRSYRMRNSEPEGQGVTSMVLGIIGLLGSCCCILLVICDILAIVYGMQSMKTRTRGMAIAGVVMGIIGICIKVLATMFNVARIAGKF